MIQLEPCFALFSGGKDSFATAKHLQEHGLLRGCVALETGIAVPEWKPTLEGMCAKHGFDLRFYATTDSFERVVQKYGFPGPGQHGMFMNYLKGRAIRQFKKANKGAILASGVRMDESSRRALSTKQVSFFEGVKIFAPIYDWTTERVWEYVRSHGYERPHAYSTLQISGDCLCGAFAQKDERSAIKFWYPAMHERLLALEALLPSEEKSTWGWGCDRKRKKKGAAKIICVECGS